MINLISKKKKKSQWKKNWEVLKKKKVQSLHYSRILTKPGKNIDATTDNLPLIVIRRKGKTRIYIIHNLSSTNLTF